MIRLKDITIEHFMCVTHTYLNFENNNICIFQGENGQGKSSVIEAISLCMKPDHKRSDKLSEYIQRHQSNPAHIELNAYLVDNPIKFDLKINKKGCERIITYGKDENGVDKTYVNSEATNLIKRLELDFYSEIIFSLQNKNDIADITPTERAALLAKLFQYNYSEQLNKIETVLLELNDKQKANKTKIEIHKSLITAKEDLKKSYKEKELPFSEEKYLLKEKEQAEIFEKISFINEIYAKISEINSKKIKLELDNKNAASNIDFLNSKLEAYNNLKKNVENYNISLKKEKLESEIKNFDDKIDATKSNINIFQKDNDKYTNDLLEYKSQNSEKTIELKNIVKKIELNEKGICPECGQSIHNINLITLNLDKTKLEESIKKLASQQEATKQLLSKNLNNIDILNKDLNTFNIEKLNAVTSLKSIDLEYQSLIDKLKEYNLDLINTDIKTNKDLITSNNEVIKNFEAELLELSEKTLNNRSLNIKYQQLQSDIKNFNNIKNENKLIVDKINELNNEITNLNKDIENIENEEPHIVQMIDTYTTAKKIFGKELPNYLTVKTCAMLDKEINAFVQTIFPNLQLCLRKSKKGVEFFYIEDSEEDIHNLNDDDLGNAKMASGYEKAVFTIAFKIALCKAYGLEFSALDEIDAAASDNNSTKTFEAIISNNIFNQIIFITHSADTVATIKSVDNNVALYHVHKGTFTLDEE